MITLQPRELASLAVGGFGAMQKWEELAKLIEEVDELAAKVIVEIGVGKGGTSWCWSKLSSVEKLISIDLPNGPWGGAENLDLEIAYINANKTPQCSFTYIPADSQAESTMNAILTLLAGSPIDFLLIDGDHSYEGVKADYEKYSPLVRIGGLIALHDVLPHDPAQNCHVDKFWKEIKKVSQYAEIIGEPKTWGGLGIIKKE